MSSTPEVAKYHLDPKTLERLYDMHNEIYGVTRDLRTRPFGHVPDWAMVVVLYIEGSCKTLKRLLPIYAQWNGERTLSVREALDWQPEAIPSKAEIDEWIAIARRIRKEAIAELERQMKSAAGERLNSEDSEE